MAVMNHAHGFLDAIREAPDDDTSRLVFSDWLEEQGEPARAELIRIQCELARLPTWEDRYPELHVRQLELQTEHEAEWLGEWAERLVRWEYRRGLLHSVTITPEVFLAHGEALFAEHPVERVALVNQLGESLEPAAVAEVVACRAMGQVRALETAGCRRDDPLPAMYGGRLATNAWLAALARAEHVGRLRELHLNGDTRNGRDSINLPIWEGFCRASHLRTLERLDLSDAYQNDDAVTLASGVNFLTRSSFAENLRAVSFALCQFNDEAARLLASAPLGRLEELDLGECGALEADGLRAILADSGFPRLRSLAIPDALPLGELVTALPERISALRLSGDWHASRRAEPGGWDVLFGSLKLRNLTAFSMRAYGSFIAEAWASLMQAPWLGNLRELLLASEDLSAEDVAPLFAIPAEGPTCLRSLSLPDCAGIGAALADWPGLAGLTELNLTRMYGQDCEEDTEALLTSPYLSPRLERLDLSGSCRTQQNVEQLAACPALIGLRWLGFGWNTLDAEMLKRLAGATGLCHLESLHLASEWELDAAAVEPLVSGGWSQLRDVVLGSQSDRETLAFLRERLGPRLRVWSDC